MTLRIASRNLVLATGLTFALAAPALSDEKLDLLKSRADRWIEVQQRLASERAEWIADKTVLENTVSALDASRKALRERIEFLETGQAEAQAERAAAEARLAEHGASESALESRLAAFEQRAEALSDSLPDPLREKLAPSLEKLRSDQSAAGGASARIQNLLSILAQIDEFNNTLAYSHVIRELPGGETIDLRVMHWGLAFAYAVSADGSRAWLLAPGDGGWEWTAQDEHAQEIAKLFEVYEKTTSPKLVAAPARVANRMEAIP